MKATLIEKIYNEARVYHDALPEDTDEHVTMALMGAPSLSMNLSVIVRLVADLDHEDVIRIETCDSDGDISKGMFVTDHVIACSWGSHHHADEQGEQDEEMMPGEAQELLDRLRRSGVPVRPAGGAPAMPGGTAAGHGEPGAHL